MKPFYPGFPNLLDHRALSGMDRRLLMSLSMAFHRLEFRNAGVDGLVGCAKKLVGLHHRIDRQAHQCWDLVAPTGGFSVHLNMRGGASVHT